MHGMLFLLEGHFGGLRADRTRMFDTVCPLCHEILIGSPEERTLALILRVRSSSMKGRDMNVVSLFRVSRLSLFGSDSVCFTLKMVRLIILRG